MTKENKEKNGPGCKMGADKSSYWAWRPPLALTSYKHLTWFYSSAEWVISQKRIVWVGCAGVVVGVAVVNDMYWWDKRKWKMLWQNLRSSARASLFENTTLSVKELNFILTCGTTLALRVKLQTPAWLNSAAKVNPHHRNDTMFYSLYPLNLILSQASHNNMRRFFTTLLHHG